MAINKNSVKSGPYYGWIIVFAMFFINIAVHASANFTFAVFLKPMSEDLSVSREAVSWLHTSRMISGGVSAIVIGKLIDRYGSRWMLPLAAIIVASAMVLLNWADNFWQILFLFIIIGIAGLAGPGSLMTSVPVSKWFYKKRGKATAIATAGLGVGGILFAPLHQVLINSHGWRGAWFISAILLVLVVVPIGLIFIRRTPEDQGLLPDGETNDHVLPEGNQSLPQNQKASPDPEDNWKTNEALKTSAMWKVLIAYSILALAMGGFIVHRFSFWSDRGIDSNVIAWSYSLDALVFACAILAAGFLVDRFPVRIVGAVAAGFQILGVLLTIFLDSVLGLYIGAMTLGLGAGTNMVVQIHIWPSYFGRKYIGTIRGIVVPATLVGMGLGPPLVGATFDGFGSYLPAFWASILLAFFSILLLISATPPKRHKAFSHK